MKFSTPRIHLPLLLGATFLLSGVFVEAQTETTLCSFSTNGAHPGTTPNAIVRGKDGNFYGTTQYGGTHNTGTFFEVSPAGVEKVLYSFGTDPKDGAFSYPSAPVLGADGNFYGTTQQGGAKGYGTVFKCTPAGVETVLYSFGTKANDGTGPAAALVQGTDGNFYGTTSSGGGVNVAKGGDGTVFKVTPAGVETVLYSFGAKANDGSYSVGALVRGADGNFYGTTESGGSKAGGTVFKVTPAGVETVLYGFGTKSGDGTAPEAALLLGTDGNFYGTTASGGSGRGTVFKTTSAGTETILHSFGSNTNDGAVPTAALVRGLDGNFYGTTSGGGSQNVIFGGDGTIFEITPAGAETVRYDFGSKAADGTAPDGLVLGADGNLYGTATLGGANSNGTVFKLTLSAPAVTAPTSAAVTSFSATLGGDAASDGGSSITGRGIVFSATAKNASPTIGGSGVTRIVAAGLTGVFSVDAAGLVPATAYSFKAYATNAFGTSYSGVAAFATPSNDAFLSALKLSSGTLSPAFAFNRGGYSASVPNSTTSITVTPTAAQANAKVKVDGVAVASDKPSQAIKLLVGSNTIKIVVTAQNGVTTETYNVVVTRAASHGEELRREALENATIPNASALITSQGTATGAPPIAARRGVYTGVLETDAPAPAFCGCVELTISGQTNDASVAAGAAFTGLLHWGGDRYALRGSLDALGAYGGSVLRSNRLAPLALTLASSVQDPTLITGTVSDGRVSTSFVARLAAFASRAEPSPYDGKYVVAFEPDPQDATAPEVRGAGIVTISSLGRLRFVARLSDGTTVSQTTTTSEGGVWSIYASIHRSSGYLAGQAQIVPAGAPGMIGTADWNSPSSKASPTGVQTSLRILGETSRASAR